MNPSRFAEDTERIPKDVKYLADFIAKSKPNDLDNQGQKSLHVTHYILLVVICA